MSAGLNAEFKRDPAAFLTAHINIQSSNYVAMRATGPIYNYALAGGVGSFDLQPSAHRPLMANLVQHDGGWLSESAITAYYLNAKTNETVGMPIGAEADYFFTDSITGCAFIAFGANRHALTVMHINALNRGKIQYMKEVLAIRALRPAFLIVYTYQDYQQGVLRGENASMVVTTLCGKRLADGWHFYTRSYIGVGGGGVNMGNMQPRGLQPTAVELMPE